MCYYITYLIEDKVRFCMVDSHPEETEHDHQHCIRMLMARAEHTCEERRMRLTPQRRRVLEIVAGGHTAIGAYDILGRLGGGDRAPAPVVVYRALDFLVQAGLVHRVESLNAYVACHAGCGGGWAQLLICRRCHSVVELPSSAVSDAIAEGAAAAGFTVMRPMVEIEGCCRACRGATDELRAH